MSTPAAILTSRLLAENARFKNMDPAAQVKTALWLQDVVRKQLTGEADAAALQTALDNLHTVGLKPRP